MESKTKKMIIIGSSIFLAVVIVSLAIVLPITLKNRGGKTNSTSSSSNTTTPPSELLNSTNITITDEPVQVETTITTESAMEEIEVQDMMPSVQKRSFISQVDMPGLINPSLIPSTNNLADGADMISSESKLSNK